MDDMRIGVIVPAAGSSRRFGTADKLSEDLGGRPLLLRTVEALARHESVHAIVVAGPPGESGDAAELRELHGWTLDFLGATIVPGGTHSRAETVSRALAAMPDDVSHIAVHDAARPLLDRELLDRVVAAGRHRNAVVPAIRVSSTVRRAAGAAETIQDAAADDILAESVLGDAGRTELSAWVSEGPVDRRGLWLVQTPQLFRAELLRRAYASIDPVDLDESEITDDAALVERMGESLTIVEGSVRNIKVTTPDDLDVVRAIMSVQTNVASGDAEASASIDDLFDD
ncbi:MAG: 2-C-methyl-D-erythritol 4-phosphate cytidylyltransferase [Phycisphaerales bacterium]